MNKHYDLIVVGGGFSGVCAAISAAKEGLNTLLIERYNCLGGAAANALVAPFMRYWSHHKETGERIYLCGNLFMEIMEEAEKLNTYKEFTFDSVGWFDEEIMKLVLNRMALKYGVKLLFNTVVTDAITDGRKITGIKAFGKSAHLEFTADYFIDATGDAELSMLSGCEFKLGRDKDNLCQPMTLSFRMGNVDEKKFHEVHTQIKYIYKEQKDKGLIKNPRDNVLVFENFNEGVLHFNSTRIIKRNPTDPFDVTEAEIEAREQVFELYNFLKTCVPGFENCRVLSTAMQIGIRESRKIVGEYTLTEEDLLSFARFPDAIAASNYEIDIHNPAGGDTRMVFFKDEEWYEIPYRCLIPKSKDNMLVVGRCISSTHEAQSSYRIMPFCGEMGQAAGIAIGLLSKDKKTDVRDVDMEKLQNILRKEGFVI